MRAPYLRQIAQPLAGSAPALRSSRRWPFRADEARVLATEPPHAQEVRSGPAPSEPAPSESAPSRAISSEPLRDSFSARTFPAAPDGLPQPPADIPIAMRPPDRSEPPARSRSPLQPRPAEPWTSAPRSSRAPPVPEPTTTEGPPAPREIRPIAAATAMPDAVAPSHVAPSAIPERSRDLARTAEPSARAPLSTAAESPRAPADRTDRSAPTSSSAEQTPPRPVKPLRGPDDDRLAGMAPPSLQQPGRGLAGAIAKSDQASEPSFKIGTVEVRVLPTLPAAPPARANSPGALSRGFSSPFGLRQG
jgi:hypothetical protein